MRKETIVIRIIHGITRVEFIGGEMIYAVRVDVSGGFELCQQIHAT